MNEQGLIKLYSTYGPAIYARCLVMLGNPAEAEDATQEVFLRVHKNLADLPDDSGSLNWIFRVASNLCLTMIRDRKPTSEIPETLASLERHDALVEDRALAEQLVRKSPKKLGLPAWLHYMEGLRLEEIAEVLGVTPRTVANRLKDFVASARKRLKREGV